MNSRTMDPDGASGWTPNLSDMASGHGGINMVNATNFMAHYKDYGTSQPDFGKDPTPPKIYLHIKKTSDSPEAPPRIPKGFLKRSRHNPNSRAS